MSPILFNVALESAIKKIPRTDTLNLVEENLLLAYTDNIVVIRERIFKVLLKN